MLNALGPAQGRHRRLVRINGIRPHQERDQREQRRELDAELRVLTRTKPAGQQKRAREVPVALRGRDGLPVIRASEGRWIKRLRFNADLPEEQAAQRQASASSSSSFGVAHSLDVAKRREIQSLRQEYLDKLAVLETWRRSEEKAIRTKYALKAVNKDWITDDPAIVCHAVGRNQFHVENAESACSAISIVSIYNFLRSSERDPKEMKWERIVRIGANLWERAQSGKQQQQRQQQPFQGVQELYRLSALEQLRKVVSVVSEEGGHLDDSRVKQYRTPVVESGASATSESGGALSFYTLREAVDLLFERARFAGPLTPAAASFTIRDTAVSLLCKGQTCWVFDSHGGLEEGKAVLIECRGADALGRYLRHKYPYEPGLDADSSELYSEEGAERHHDMNTFFMIFFKSTGPHGEATVSSDSAPVPSVRHAGLVTHARVSGES